MGLRLFLFVFGSLWVLTFISRQILLNYRPFNYFRYLPISSIINQLIIYLGVGAKRCCGRESVFKFSHFSLCPSGVMISSLTIASNLLGFSTQLGNK